MQRLKERIQSEKATGKRLGSGDVGGGDEAEEPGEFLGTESTL